MKSKRAINFNLFVVWQVEKRLSQKEIDQIVDFDISTIREPPYAYLARGAGNDTTEEVLKNRLHEIFGQKARILNVLEDDKGHLFIPTGNISVVLTHEFPQQNLKDWAQAKRLQVLSQSKWRPQAVVLATETDDPSELINALRDLRNDPHVEVAEQEVLTQFQRE